MSGGPTEGTNAAGWLDDGAEAWHGLPVVRKVADALPRHRAVLEGVVRRVAARATPEKGGHRSPGSEFDVWLSDGTGELLLRFVGRSVVAGIVPGAALRVEGTVVETGGVPAILNPLYRFEPDGSSATSTSW